MRPPLRRITFQIVLPMIIVAAATYLTYHFPVLKNRSSLFLFLSSVMFCTTLGGLPAGVYATVLSMLASSWFFLSSDRSFVVGDPNEVFRLVIFSLISVMFLSLHAARAKAEKKSRASEQRLVLALDSAHMGVWDYDLITRKFWWSKTLEGIYSRDAVSFAGGYSQFFGYIHFDDQPLFNRAITRTIDEGADYEVEHRIVLPDESIRWVSTRGRLFFNETSRAERIVGVAVDVTAKHNYQRHEEFSRHPAGSSKWTTVA